MMTIKTRWKYENLFLIASATRGTKENPIVARMTKAKTISICGIREARSTVMRIIALIDTLPEIMSLSWFVEDEVEVDEDGGSGGGDDDDDDDEEEEDEE